MRVMTRKLMMFAAAAAMAFSMTACGSAKDSSGQSTSGTESAESAATESTAEDADEATESSAEESTVEDAETSEDSEGEVKTYKSEEGWKIDYNTKDFDMIEADDGVHFTYKGECAGTDCVIISYVQDKMPSEVLYDNIKNADDSLITRSEGWFGSNPEDWSFNATIDAGTEGSGLGESYRAAEHNGGTLLEDIITHREANEEDQTRVDDTLSGLLDTFEFTNHEPQQQYAYVPGTYETTVTEEIDGTDATYTYSIELDADHTGVMNEQDTIDCYWTSTEIVDNAGNRYEYTIEGDNLLLNRMDDIWDTYTKVTNDTAKTDAAAGKNDAVTDVIARYAGTYKDEIGNSVTITKDGTVTIDILSLIHMEGTISGYQDDVLQMTVKDANDKDIVLSYNTETSVLKVEESTWSLLPADTEFEIVIQ